MPAPPFRHTRACRGYLAALRTMHRPRLLSPAQSAPERQRTSAGALRRRWSAQERRRRAQDSALASAKYPRPLSRQPATPSRQPAPLSVIPALAAGISPRCAPRTAPASPPPLRPLPSASGLPPGRSAREVCAGTAQARAGLRAGPGRDTRNPFPSYPRPFSVIPAPLFRHTRARRGYLAALRTTHRPRLPSLAQSAPECQQTSAGALRRRWSAQEQRRRARDSVLA